MKGKLAISVSKDTMIATASIIPDNDIEVTESYILGELDKFGIKAGIDKAVGKKMVEDEEYYDTYTVAVGKNAIQGTDGFYEFFFNTDMKNKKPAIRLDGSVDYSVQRELTVEGTKLAQYHPAKPGSFGYTVFASVIAPVPAKEASPLILKQVDKRGNDYYAKKSGQIVLDGSELSVQDELYISGDVGYGTGHINFNGDVHITGSVNGGVRINVTGKVEIDGVVESCYIESGKDIIIKRGVHGRGRAELIARNSVVATFLEEATIEADCIMIDHMINCNATARKKVCASGKNGVIIGGVTTAGERIEADVISNEKGIKTTIILRTQPDRIVEKSAIIINKKAYEGINARINNMVLKINGSGVGEYRIVDYEIKKYEIGMFKYDEVKYKKTRPRVLLVDDEPIILKTFFSFLSGKYEVAAVNSARDAFAYMKNTIPDLILLDYRMPSMTGGEMLEIMRTMPELSSIPVYFVTSVVDRAVILKCLSLYPQGYLLKPLGKDELLEVVDGFFAGKSKK